MQADAAGGSGGGVRQHEGAGHQARLRELVLGFRVTQMLHVAAVLGVADHLRDGPHTAAALADRVGAEPAALHRLLRALARLGVFAQQHDGSFALNPLAALLRSDVPGSMHGLARLYGEDWMWRAYGQLLHSVRTGRPAFDQVHGEPFFAFLGGRPAEAAVFNAAMTSFTAEETAAILAAYDFAPFTSVADLGGGHGALVMALLRAHPQLRGVVVDLPAVAAGAARKLTEAGLGDRAGAVAGDLSNDVPAGADLYILKRVLHDWDDATVGRILAACRRAMADDGRLLVIERIIPDGDGGAEATLFDINMLVVTGGRERTAAEFGELLAGAGLALARVIPTSVPVSLIEAVPTQR